MKYWVALFLAASIVAGDAAIVAEGGAMAPPTQEQTAAARPLYPSSPIRDSLAGGQRAVFSFDVPPQSAARIVIRQEGVDVYPTLRPKGSDLPERGYDMAAGLEGEELVYPLVAETPATWTLIVAATVARAARGDYSISLEIAPADDRSRAVALARQQYQISSDTSRGADAKSMQLTRAGHAAVAAAALAAGDKAMAAEATYQCARSNDLLGDFPEAIEWQRRALALFRELGRRDREARALNRLGDLSRKVGEVSDAERYFQEALPLARAARDPSNIADILNNSGLLMLAIGRWEEAIDQLEAAIPMAQAIDSADVEGALTHNIGEAYTRLGVYDKAIEWYRRSIEVKKRLNSPRRTARTLYSLASTYFELGESAAAEQTMKTALDLYEQSGDRAGLADTLGFHARMQYARGETDRALGSFARALPMLHEVQSRGPEARVLTAWAEVEIDRGEIEPALQKLDEALRLARAIASPSAKADALYTRGLALQKANRLDEAVASVAEAIQDVETMRGAIVKSELRTSYLATVRSYYDLHVELLQQRGEPAAAFEVSERSRARTLLEGLAESASKIRKGVDPQLLARQRAVQSQLNAKEAYRAQVALSDGEKSPRALALGRDIERLLEEWKDTQAKIRVSSPAFAALHMPEPVSADRVQHHLLDADSALVEYHLGPRRSYAWVIDRQSITVHDVPPVAKIDEVARRYHDLLSRDTSALAAAERDKLAKEITGVGQRLAALVWKPIEARVGGLSRRSAGVAGAKEGKRLLIVADGALQYVPFAALPASSGAPLITRHEIVYLPSASVLETIRRDSRPFPATMVAAVFADPVFSKNDPRIAGQAERAAVPQTRADEGGRYPRLRFSRREAEAIAAASPGALQALDFSAAKKTLTSRDLRKYRVLHFATHGSLDTARPELSGLVLSLVEPGGKPVDGFLRLHEIYNLDLDADLVVLSACRTALGREVHGEGLIGLTRGFMYAGASRVVSSVWNVDDRASALLMSRFYTAMLSKRLAPAAALRDAQLSLLGEERWSHPHYWAAFGLQGEWK